MPEIPPSGRHYMVGGGIAALSAAALLVRDGGVTGDRITILEHASTTGGSLDGSGDALHGYLARGGRMFEARYVCTRDVLSSIPLSADQSPSVLDDIEAFNRMVPSRSDCRIVRAGQKAEDRARLGLDPGHVVTLNRLFLSSENRLGGKTIEQWFAPSFFDTNFWIMWSTMFSFQPWHSLAEMRRYMRRFLHLFPGLARIEGVLRTRFNQYDSVILPVQRWLAAQGVQFRTDCTVQDANITATGTGREVTALQLAGGETIAITPSDRVYLTLGSMTDAAVTGDRDDPPPDTDGPATSFDLWRRLAARNHGFGNPEVFCGTPEHTSWTSFTVTLASPAFFTFMEDFSGNRTGTGGLVTFAGSGWTLSIVMLHQPHFAGQPATRPTFWGYGLRSDQPGDLCPRPLNAATGDDILRELAHQLRLAPDQAAEFFAGAQVLTCRMPYITSQFMPRRPGDRPQVVPQGAANFAVIGQFCDLPRDCVFTVEYSVRSAWVAVHALNGSVPQPPPVHRSDRDPRVLLRAARVLLGG